MIHFVLAIFLMFSASFSFAEEEALNNEMDEIQEVIEESSLSENSDSLLNDLNKAGHSNLGLKALTDPRVKDVIAKQFDDSNISLMSLAQKRAYFNEHFKDSHIKVLLDKIPKAQDVFVDVITDKDSMLGLISIFQKEKERIHLLYVVIGVFFFNLILKKIIINPSSHFLMRLIQRMTVNIFCFFLTSGALFYFFKKELTPIVRVIRTHF